MRKPIFESPAWLAAALLGVIAYTMLANGAVGIVACTILSALTMGLVIVTLRRFDGLPLWFLSCLVGFFCTGGVGLLRSQAKFAAAEDYALMLTYGVLGLCSFAIQGQPRTREHVLKGLAILAIGNAGVGIIQESFHVAWVPSIFGHSTNPIPGRACGLMFNPNRYAEVCAAGLVVLVFSCLWPRCSRTSPAARRAAIPLIFLTIGIGVSGSRGALLALWATLSLGAVLLFFKGVRWKTLAVVLGLMAAVQGANCTR